MANLFKSSTVYPISAEGLLDIMTSEEYQMINMESQPQNKEGKFTEVSRDENKMVFRMDVVEWGKNKVTKSLDKSKTEQTQNVTTWDLKNMKAEWEYFGPEKKAKVWGSIQIVPKGDQAEMTDIFNISVSIPVIGGTVEKIVIKEVEKHWPGKEERLMDFVNKKK